MEVSRKFIEAVKLSDERQYRIAQAARVDPSFLSRILNRIDTVKPGDERLFRLAKVLNLRPEECYEHSEKT